MNAKKEGKQGFWASLFGRKPCGCACGEGIKMDTGATPASTCACQTEGPQAEGVKRTVKVLGPRCAKCKATYQAIERVAAEHHLDITLTKVDDIAEIMAYNVLTTPAVVVDGVVKIKGHVPTEREIKEMLGLSV